jgi:hypothetical protein
MRPWRFQRTRHALPLSSNDNTASETADWYRPRLSRIFASISRRWALTYLPMVAPQQHSTIEAFTVAATTGLRRESFTMVSLAEMEGRSNFADHPMSHRPL